jgi:SAM-dependent methyltransferase
MKTNKALLRRYAKIAKRWNCPEYDGLRRDDLIPKILGCADINSLSHSPIILEAMCGTGNIGKMVGNILREHRKDPRMFFLDFSQEMLKRITTSGEKVCRDIRDTGFAENFLDRIFLRGALHDLPREMQFDAIAEIYRILKPCGLLTLIVSYAADEAVEYFNKIICLKDTLSGNAGEMERYFATKNEYICLLIQAGFNRITNPFDYDGEATYAERIISDGGPRTEFDEFFYNLPKNIRRLWKVRKGEKGITFNFPYAVLTARK